MNLSDALGLVTLRGCTNDEPTISQHEVVTLLNAMALTGDADGNAPSDDEYEATYSTLGVYRVVAEVWTIKAGKMATAFDFTTDGQTFRRSQMIDHFEAQAALWRRKTNMAAPC